MHIKMKISSLSSFAFVLCVVSERIFSSDPTMYVFSKYCMFFFFAVMCLDILYTRKIILYKGLLVPAIFVIYMIASCLWAPNGAVAFSQLITQIQLVVLFIFMYLYYAKGQSLDLYFKAIYISGYGLSIYTIYTYGVQGIISTMLSGGRLGGELFNENTFGMNLAISGVIASYYFLHKKKKTAIVGIVLFFILSMSSGSKKALAIYILGVFGVIVLKYGIRKMYKAIVMLIFASVLIWMALQTPAFEVINDRVMGYLSAKRTVSDDIRASMITTGISMFWERPFFGWGMQNFRIYSGFGTYSHNNFVEIAVNFGLVGFILYYLIYMKAGLELFKQGFFRKNKVAMIFLLTFFISVAMEYAMVTIYVKQIWITLGICLGWLDSGTKENDKD